MYCPDCNDELFDIFVEYFWDTPFYWVITDQTLCNTLHRESTKSEPEMNSWMCDCCLSCAVIHRWMLNDSFILPMPGSRFSLMGGNLHITNLNKDEDVGIYQCFASNSFGTIISREASLHVACKFTHDFTHQCLFICLWFSRDPLEVWEKKNY